MRILQYIGCNVSSVSGAVRSFCKMACALAARGHDVYAVCNDFRPGRPFYPLDERVHFINLDGSGYRTLKPATWIKDLRPLLPSVCKAIWDRYVERPWGQRKNEPLEKLVREIQPNAIISFDVNDYFLIPRQSRPDWPVVLVSHRTSGKDFVSLMDVSERVSTINTWPHLHVLQHSYIAEIQALYHGCIHAIPNDVPQVDEKDTADLTVEKPLKTIIMISRLHSGKQQHLLIQAFERLAKRYPDWKVEIYGPPHKKTYRHQLERMIVSLDLTGQVKLMGTTNRPLEVLRNADIFAFPSHFHEGFNNALAEAMATGLPCVGLKNTPSVKELIVDGVNGFLTENTPEDFAQKLKLLMDDQDLRRKMGKAGHDMMKEYVPERIYDQWEKLLLDVVKSSNST